ncbi:hypothetical protein DFH09DRAFT_1372493 [Mycena vulgaris]|nr:hypothetical protein DFH09DRAFT_1372493 [Mycena vulgaris]
MYPDRTPAVTRTPIEDTASAAAAGAPALLVPAHAAPRPPRETRAPSAPSPHLGRMATPSCATVSPRLLEHLVSRAPRFSRCSHAPGPLHDSDAQDERQLSAHIVSPAL